MTTYAAMEIGGGGSLTPTCRPLPAPGPEQVLIRVEACGICGADAGDIRNGLQGRVPGHEVVGRITAIGSAVPAIWKIDQRVGVGRFGGHCGTCRECRRGAFHLCRNQPVMGASMDGGYAEMMLARATGLVSIPDELSSEEAAPILCAGIATFNALKKSGAEPGDTVVVFGIGGLGHMALQYARAMGFRVVAVGRGADIAGDAMLLGAHRYIDSAAEDAAQIIGAMGGAKAILTMLADPAAISALMPVLQPEGRLVLLGAGADPLPVSMGHLVGAERSIQGSITGSPYENERTLDFSVLTGARPLIETMPLSRAPEAFERMRSGAVKFRMVLVMEEDYAHQ